MESRNLRQGVSKAFFLIQGPIFYVQAYITQKSGTQNYVFPDRKYTLRTLCVFAIDGQWSKIDFLRFYQIKSVTFNVF